MNSQHTSRYHIHPQHSGLTVGSGATKFHLHYGTLRLEFKGKEVISFVKTHLSPWLNKLRIPEWEGCISQSPTAGISKEGEKQENKVLLCCQ